MLNGKNSLDRELLTGVVEREREREREREVLIACWKGKGSEEQRKTRGRKWPRGIEVLKRSDRSN